MTRRAIAGLSLLMTFAGGGWAQAAPDGLAVFTRCAACHLPTGAGVPGTYPPLREQIAGFARTRSGREYLVTVVSHGLVGSIRLRGEPFNGFMPAQPLSDAETAAVLNYVAGDIAAARPPAKPFTDAEVAMIRRRHPSATAQDSRALRPAGVDSVSK